MNIAAFCDALAAQLAAGLSSVAEVYPVPTPNVQSGTVTVSPAPDWGTWGPDENFCAPSLRFELVLVASTTDFRESMLWFMARLDELRTVFDDDPSVDATCDGVSVAGWSQPEIVSTGSGDALAVRVQLNPVTLED